MKRILSLILVLILICSFTACKKENDSSDIDTSSLVVQTEDKIESSNLTSTETAEFVEPNDYAAILQLTINPKFKIYLDKNYKVVAVQALNDDAKAVLAACSRIVDDTFETAIDKLISKGKDKGYVKRNSPVNIEIFYINKKTADTEKITNRIKNLSKDMSQKYSAIVKFKTPSDKDNNKTTTSSNNTTTSSTPTKPTHTHSFSSATCTNPPKCSCGITKGQALGHNYNNGKCSRCNAKDPNYVEKYDVYVNGKGFNLNSEVTVDIYLKTNDKEINVCPCITSYKKVGNQWQPFDASLGDEEYFSLLDNKSDPIFTEDDEMIYYGRWTWMNNYNSQQLDFTNSKIIVKYKARYTEPGEYKIVVTDGKTQEQNNYKYNDSLSMKIY